MTFTICKLNFNEPELQKTVWTGQKMDFGGKNERQEQFKMLLQACQYLMRIWPRVWHHIKEGTEKWKREQLGPEESRGGKVELMRSNNVYGCLPG